MDRVNNTDEMNFNRRRNSGRIGCRALTCGCLFFLMFICCMSVLLLISKPVNIWSGIVDFLNNDIQIRVYEEIDSRLVQNRINSQITTVDNLKVILDENELTSLAREKLPTLNNLVLDLTPDRILFVWDVDKTIEDKPLKGIFEFELKDKKLELTRVGTNRIDAPGFLKKLISQVLLSVMKVEKENFDESFLNSFFSSSQVNIESIVIDDTTLTIDGKINVDIFN